MRCATTPFVVEEESGRPVATGYLDLRAASVEAIFTLPAWAERLRRNDFDDHHRRSAAAESPAPDAGSDAECGRFYLRHGFVAVREKLLPSAGEGGFTLRGDGAPAQLTSTARRCATV